MYGLHPTNPNVSARKEIASVGLSQDFLRVLLRSTKPKEYEADHSSKREEHGEAAQTEAIGSGGVKGGHMSIAGGVDCEGHGTAQSQ